MKASFTALSPGGAPTAEVQGNVLPAGPHVHGERRELRALVALEAPRPRSATSGSPQHFPEARRRWAELLRRIYEVDPFVCPASGGAMRILAFITEAAVIDRILGHLRRSARGREAPT